MDEERKEFKTRLRKRILSRHILAPLSFILIIASGIWDDSTFLKYVATFFVVGLCMFFFIVEWYIDLEDENA